MLRNELFNKASQYDNDPVVVQIGGIFVGVEDVIRERECVVLVLDAEDLSDALGRTIRLVPEVPDGADRTPASQ